jgi:hypothetical protein
VALPIIFTRDWTMKGRGSEDEERSQGTLIDSTFRTNVRRLKHTGLACKKLRFVQRHERQVPPKLLDI